MRRDSPLTLLLTLLPIGLLCLGPAGAQAPERIDLNGGAGPLVGSNPSGLYRAVDGTVYFSACTPEHGCEPWRSDGSAAGTVLLKDIRPGRASSSPFGFGGDANGQFVYFSADDGSHGRELWRSDGTEAGTVLVADLTPGLDGSFPASILPIGGDAVIFSASSAGLGKELYRSSGNSIELVLDLNPGSGSGVANNSGGVPDLVSISGNRVVFAGRTPATGVEPFISDGSAAGTVPIRNIAAGSGNSNPYDFVEYAGGIAFVARTDADGEELYVSDLTSAGTVRVSQIAAGSGNGVHAILGVSGALIFLAGSNGSNGIEPYVWTGSAIVQLAEINPGAASGLSSFTARRHSAVSGGILYFPASVTGVTGEELWRSDGTPAGTAPVIDLVPGPDSGAPRQMTPISDGAFTGVLFVSALGSSSAIGTLHRSDGTSGGTFALDLRKSTDPGTGMLVVGAAGGQNALLPAADDADARDMELWRSGAGIGSAVQVKDIASHQGSSLPSTPIVAGASAYFAAYTAATGFELFVSRGSAASTTLVSDMRPGPESALIQSESFGTGILEGIGLGERLIYFADAPGAGYELHVSDGSESGTLLLADLSTGSSGSFPHAFASSGNRAFVLLRTDVFGGGPNPQTLLIASDGSPAGTVPLNPGCSIETQDGLLAVGPLVYFLCTEANFGRELYRVDSATLAIQRVTDLAPGPDSASITLLGPIGLPPRLLFMESSGDRQLYVSDGSSIGTTLIHTAPPDRDFSAPGLVDVIGNAWLRGSEDGQAALFRVGTNPPHALTLALTYAPAAAAPDGDSASVASTGCSIVFKDALPGEGMELLRVRTDTLTGGALQPSLQPGPLSSTPDGLHALAGTDAAVLAALSGNAGSEGVELLRLAFRDNALTVTTFDIAPGAASSSPANFASLGPRLLFSAHTAAHGRELYILPPPDRIFGDDFSRGCGLPPL